MKANKPDADALNAIDPYVHTTFRLRKSERDRFKKVLVLSGDKMQQVLYAAVIDYCKDNAIVLETPVQTGAKHHEGEELERPVIK